MSVVTPQRLPVRALRRVLDGIRQGSIDNAVHALEEPFDEALHLDYELALLRAKERHPLEPVLPAG